MKRIVLIIILTGLTAFSLAAGISCTDKSTAEPQPAIEAEIAGRWNYAFFEGYESVPGLEYYSDPEGGFVDAITIATVNINKKWYLILSFDPLSSKFNSRLFIFAMDNSLSPRLVSTITSEKQDSIGLLVRSAAVYNNILYATLFLDKGLWMVDISDPAHPVDLGIAPIEVTSNLVVDGDYAYATGQMYNGVSVNDISDTQNVKEVARVAVPSRDCHIAVSDERLYVGIGQTLNIFDISTPASPKTLCTYELNVPEGLDKQLPNPVPGQIHWDKWASIIDLQSSGNYVYATFGAGQLRVIDVSVLTAPHEVADVNLGGFAIALTLQDNFLYVTKSDKESQKLQMCIVDISKQESPRLLDSVMTESVFGFGGASHAYCWMRPQVIGDYVYIAGINYMDVIKTK